VCVCVCVQYRVCLRLVVEVIGPSRLGYNWKDGPEPDVPYHHIFSKKPPPVKDGGSVAVSADDSVSSGRATAWCDWDGADERPTEIRDGNATHYALPPPLPPALFCSQNCPPGFEDTLDCTVKLPGTYCPNQCNGRGYCSAGFCHCGEQWWGADCSLRNPFPDEDNNAAAAAAGNSRELPRDESWAVKRTTTEVKRRRARPLVYVYEIPSDFNAGVHQRRFRDFECVPRAYERDSNDAVKQAKTFWYYSLEAAFHEYLMRSAHRTTDPAEADFFFVPVYSACFHLRYNKPMPRWGCTS
jgi:hypothetical protein